MPREYTLREAKAHLSELLDQAAAGQPVEITRQGRKKGRFRLVASDSDFAARKAGVLKGKIVISDDFDAEDDSIIADFEG